MTEKRKKTETGDEGRERTTEQVDKTTGTNQDRRASDFGCLQFRDCRRYFDGVSGVVLQEPRATRPLDGASRSMESGTKSLLVVCRGETSGLWAAWMTVM